MTGEGDGYGEMVRTKGGMGVPMSHWGVDVPAKKCDIWRGGLALGGESGIYV